MRASVSVEAVDGLWLRQCQRGVGSCKAVVRQLTAPRLAWLLLLPCSHSQVGGRLTGVGEGGATTPVNGYFLRKYLQENMRYAGGLAKHASLCLFFLPCRVLALEGLRGCLGGAWRGP